ncbi:MAG: glycoside hydrolase family 13 protein [Muribaculaceae bacterium]|nr:glycoside hydrolase family 13 protein [Muribaculaceae bacterium]
MLASLIMAVAATTAPTLTIDNVEPPYWWTGMNNDTLQIMITGPGIADAEVSGSYPGVKLIEEVNPGSPDYKLLYYTIGSEAKPGKMPITLKVGDAEATIDYQLRQRTKKAEDFNGFSSADVLYLLMPDRFAQGNSAVDVDPYEGLEYKVKPNRENPNGRHGGNIQGIIDHLDYLKDLGVTAIWACPVLENDMPGGSYHGYATTNYYKIDPRFGTNEEWALLVKEADKRGMKVVMDMIFNHSGVNHPWLENMPADDWFNHPEGDVMTNFRLSTVHDPYASDFDKDATVNGWFVPSMPDLNQRNPHLMRYLIQNSIWWIESSEINGIRMDTYPYADMDGMASWIDAVMTEYPNFNIVGECWYDNEGGSAFWQKGNRLNPTDPRLPVVMDFKLILKGRDFFMTPTTPWTGLNGLYDHLAMDFMFPDPSKILTFLDNHDTDRFLLEEPENLDSWKQAITFLLTSRGIPQIYYGTELLMNGSKEGSDGFVRRDFPGGFEGDEVNAFTPEGRTDLQNEAWNYLSTLLKWRRDEANDVIANGTLKHFMPINCAYVYERRLGDKQVVVLINGTDEPLELQMARYAEIMPKGTQMKNVLTDEQVTIGDTLVLQPRQTLLLQNF